MIGKKFSPKNRTEFSSRESGENFPKIECIIRRVSIVFDKAIPNKFLNEESHRNQFLSKKPIFLVNQ